MNEGLPGFVQQGPIGVLPPGRWQCSWAEFERVFAGAGVSRMRRAVFEDFLAFVNLQRRHGLRVSSYWVNGSFVTTKRNPGDVDFVALVERSASSGSPTLAVESLLNPGGTWKRRDHPDVGRRLLIDGFAAVAPLERVDVVHDDYAAVLHEFDVLFRRIKDSPSREKGYVEVIA